MKVVCIVQARMGSTRLPGKILKEVKGKPLISHTLDRLKRCRNIHEIVLATSDLPQDAVLESAARKSGVHFFAGSENDVLDRYYQAAVRHRPDIVVRCTGDCPLIDPVITDLVIRRNLQSGADYTSNTIVRSYPRGLDTEVFKFSVLQRIVREATKDYEREHVTPYIYQHPELFSIESVVAEPEQTQPDLRICVDTIEDFRLIENIFYKLDDQDPYFGVDRILDLIEKNPHLKAINAHIEQKKL